MHREVATLELAQARPLSRGSDIAPQVLAMRKDLLRRISRTYASFRYTDVLG